jgi:2-desacetyl-2-hydroxyethyl bacteriochlorophyllide A dehydrogenase
MKAIVTRLLEDRKREKVLVADWEDVGSPTGNQVKTKTLYSGVTNGTERNDLLGGNYANKDEFLPRGWGYQNVGRVIEIGPDVHTLKLGDVLYMSADHCEYVVYAENGLLVKLPAGIDPAEAALFGMASVAMRTCRNAEVGMGKKVLVVGSGCIGQFATQIAAGMGGRVTICDVDERRLELARQIGAAENVINSSRWDEQILPSNYDSVMDFAGVPGMEDKLIAAVKSRGKLMFIAGRSQVSYTFNLGQGHEIDIRQNSHFDNDDLANLCRLVGRGIVKVKPLIWEIAPAEQAKHIYDTLRDQPAKLLGTVFQW